MNASTEIHMLKLAMKVMKGNNQRAVSNNKCVKQISKVEQQMRSFDITPSKNKDVTDNLDKKINEDYKKMIAYLAAIHGNHKIGGMRMEKAKKDHIPCPLCHEKNIEINMEMDQDKNFWRCPLCWTELWPDENKLRELIQQVKSKILEKKMREANKRSIYPDPLPLVHIIDPSKRRSGKSGRSRKKEVKKPRYYELY